MTGARNPYHYGTPVSEEHFAGRDNELAALLSRLRNGINVVLLSPRRYGKTSLLLRAEAELRQADDAAVIHVNLLKCRDLSVVASQLATAAFDVPGGQWHRAAQAVPDFLKRIRVSPTVTFDGDKPKFTFEARLAEADVDGVISDVYRLLAEAAKKRPAAIVLDEFQAVVELAPHLPRLLKGLSDEHGNVSLVLAGSKQHVMDALVVSPNSALYNMAERLALAPLPADVMAAYLQDRAKVGKKPMNADVAGLVVSLAGPVPNDIQRLAYESYDAAIDHIDEVSVQAGLRHAVEHEAATYADRYERLSHGQRQVIAAIAETSPAQPTSGEFVVLTGLANPSSVRKALTVLEEDELVLIRDGRWTVADPFFAAWLRTP